jgi:hypothetical protein
MSEIRSGIAFELGYAVFSLVFQCAPASMTKAQFARTASAISGSYMTPLFLESSRLHCSGLSFLRYSLSLIIASMESAIAMIREPKGMLWPLMPSG